MNPYPKTILSVEDQIKSYIDAEMIITSEEEVVEALTTIGYYRLRGYCRYLYDKKNERYQPETKFSDVVSLYNFDVTLSHLVFSMISSIEVTLRVHLIEALLIYKDPLILNDPVVFSDKKLYWQNMSAVASEINRSNDAFIKHNFKNHDGQIPLWAAVEVMSFGTLSKIINNLKTGEGTAYSKLSKFYNYKTPNGNLVSPDLKKLSSWIHVISILRNICAHNSRIYNRAISVAPVLLEVDKIVPQPKYNGLYQVMLAMKYLRPTDKAWINFVSEFKKIVAEYGSVVNLSLMGFPDDWEDHFII